MIKRIHVNQHIIKSNKNNNTNDPVLSVKIGKRNIYGHEVEILGTSKLIYSPHKPLSCGAKVWLETHASVLIDGKEIHAQLPVQ